MDLLRVPGVAPTQVIASATRNFLTSAGEFESSRNISSTRASFSSTIGAVGLGFECRCGGGCLLHSRGPYGQSSSCSELGKKHEIMFSRGRGGLRDAHCSARPNVINRECKALESSRTSHSQASGKGSSHLSAKISGETNAKTNPFTKFAVPDGKLLSLSASNVLSSDDLPELGHGSESLNEFSRRDFMRDNPLIEQLQRMQDEIEENDDDADEISDFEGTKGWTFARDNSSVELMEINEKSAMSRIVEKLSSIPSSRRIYESKNRGVEGSSSGLDSIFRSNYGKPNVNALESVWTTPDHPMPNPGAALSRQTIASEMPPTETVFPWERDDHKDEAGASRHLTGVDPPSLAELTISDAELARLRSLGSRTRRHVKIGELGVTRKVVESVHTAWRDSEVVKVRCEGPVARTMRRVHDALEEKTGGLVVWRAGGACLVYRGKDYVPPISSPLPFFSEEACASSEERGAENEVGTDNIDEGNGKPVSSNGDQKIFIPRVSDVYDVELEQEIEEILSTLGPRYSDWTGMKPIPVDADLIIGQDVEFRKPFRQLPYGLKSSLTNLEMTNLRRLSKPIPPHFVLGVNRGLDGLAAAIVKVWERSEIAKIAVKRGVQNTNHEIMSRELKRLTGGVLLARDKYFIVLYRGKDFLPHSVAVALEEGEKVLQVIGKREEAEKNEEAGQSLEAEDLDMSEGRTETACRDSLEQGLHFKDHTYQELRSRSAKDSQNDRARQIHRKVSIILAKKNKAELELQKVEERLAPVSPPPDREHITEEERNMFSKLGKKMHSFLLLGRRGVFGGTIENMHLHWKHRELVKIVYKARDRVDLEQTARMLEYESGGVLVSTVPTNKGQAIILYRGKNYERPSMLRPPNLLSKRDALKRSIELQRRESLTKHLLSLEKDVSYLQADLSNVKARIGASPIPSTDEATDEPTSVPESNVEIHGEDSRSPTEGVTGSSSEVLHKDAIFRATPLSRRERLVLRQQALKEKKGATHFNVGHSNVVAGLAKAIRAHFRRRALVKVGVKGRAKGTPIEEIRFQLEEATGGTLVSQEHSKIILYRGWPEGQLRPTEENGRWEMIAPVLLEAIRAEEEPDDADYLHESDFDDSGSDEEKETDINNSDDGECAEAEASTRNSHHHESVR